MIFTATLTNTKQSPFDVFRFQIDSPDKHLISDQTRISGPTFDIRRSPAHINFDIRRNTDCVFIFIQIHSRTTTFIRDPNRPNYGIHSRP